MKSKTKNIQPSEIKNNFINFYPYIIFCFSFLLYYQSIDFKFVMFDDDILLGANEEFFTKDGSLKTIFTTDAFLRNDGTFYRPLQNLSYLIDIKIASDAKAKTCHFNNVLLFSLITFSLYYLLIKFKISHYWAFLGVLLYAAHPLFTSAVVWMPGRGDLLLTLFAIISFIFWISFLENKKNNNLFLTWLFFTLALFSKETAALLPVLYLLYFLVFTSKRKIDFRLILSGFLLLCSGIGWFILRTKSIMVYDTNMVINDYLNNLIAIPTALALFIVPYDFSTVPGYTAVKTIIGLVILLLIVVLVVKNKTQIRKENMFYIVWFLLLLIPTFFAKTKDYDYLEHRFLLPMAGIFPLILSLTNNISKTKTKKSITVLAVVLTIFLSTVTVFKSKTYSNPHTFCDAARYNKNKLEVYHYLKGNLECHADNHQAGIKEYDMAISLRPDHAQAFNNRAFTKFKIQDWEGSLADYNKSIELGISIYATYRNRGVIYMEFKDFEKAIEDFEKALKIEETAAIYLFLGQSHLELENYNAALENFEKSLALEKRVDIYYKQGRIYQLLEENEKAIEKFNQFILEGYANPEVYVRLGLIYGKMGDIQNAIDCFTKAIEMDSRYIVAYYNRAFANYISKNYSTALDDCNIAITIDPSYSSILVLKNQIMKQIR